MKLYISCPILVSKKHLVNAKQMFTKLGFSVDYWEQGTLYSDNKLRWAEGVAFILPARAFKCPISSLSAGIRSEYALAKDLGKKLFVAYCTMDGVWNLYDLKEENLIISGVTGTSSKNAKLPQKTKSVFAEAIEGWESYEGKIEYKTLADTLPCDADIIKAYLESAPIPIGHTYYKATGEKRTFSEMAIIQQKTRVRRLLLL